ncbi:MAG: methyltransferase domain-containing protein [Lachnospiraceae bacterium]|nr:methyltransferase domain-containing protein [Lachnospiraceae bacterium]
MEYRKIFDTIPDQFDKYRPRYSKALFDALIFYTKTGPGKKVLEIGPGTGQASEPIIKSGCDYNAIELGEHLYAKMIEKFGSYENFHIVNDDFITHDFKDEKYDLIYSAATIQWIPEEIAFSKTFELLKPGGTLAMLMTIGDYEKPNKELYDDIQKVYDEYFKPTIPYTHGDFKYENAVNYGFVDFERQIYFGQREMNADEFVKFSGTHCDHMVIPEPYKTKFFDGLRNAVLAHGDKVVFEDIYVMFLTKKPLE